MNDSIMAARDLYECLGDGEPWHATTTALAVTMEMNVRFRDIDPDCNGARAEFLSRDNHVLSGRDYIHALKRFGPRRSRTGLEPA